MREINIGLLLPSSTILPVGKDFEKGLKDAINKHFDTQLQVTITKEFIGQGSFKQAEDACNKLFNYDDVDIITGVISNRVGEELAEKFKSRKKPLIVNNLGGHVPCFSKLNEYVFINSHHLWQHAWALGNWGVKTFGNKGMYISSVYDAGYSFSHMFNEGMMAADATSSWSFSVPPMPEAGQLTDMSVVFPFLEEYQPDFVFATFCGEETTLFLNEFIRHGWDKKTKLTGLPFLLAPFSPLINGIELYTTLSPSVDAGLPAEKSFYHLGYTTGIAVIRAAIDSDTNALHYQLRSAGTLLSVNNGKEAFKGVNVAENITIMHNNIKAGDKNIVQKQAAIHVTLPLKDRQLHNLTNGVNAGWQNPYLCV